MKPDELLDAIGDAREAYIQDVKTAKPKKKKQWGKFTSAIAACLVLIMGINFLMNGLGGNSGGGGDSDLTYMYYTGPVFPLTIQGESAGITAQRDTLLDFSPYRTFQESYEHDGEVHEYDRYFSEAKITDSYVLKNESGEDQTVTLLYPFAGNMRDVWAYPTLTVDGTEVSAQLNPGPYSGGFEGVWGAEDPEGTVNVKALDCYQGYAQLLSNGVYQNMAFDEFPSLDIPVVVYKLHDYVYSETTENVNPTLNMEFYIDYEKSYVFSYNMNGASWNQETGYCSRHIGAIEYRPNVAPERQHPGPGYVIIMGDDIESYTIQGYRDGGCDEGEELDDLSCTVTRYETTLEAIMADLLESFMYEYFWKNDNIVYGGYTEEDIPPFELYLGLAAELLNSYGVIGDTPMQRYDTGMLEDIFSGTFTDGRVLYLTYDVTIPKGESVEVVASMTKDASIDYVGKDKGKDGYDMATLLGTNIRFTSQTASIAGFEEIEIVGQNFGFDPANGITTVTLDLSQPHYWIEVRKPERN